MARVWTYHQVTDDILILLPAAAAYRLALQAPSPPTHRRATAAFALVAAAGLLPTRLFSLPDPGPLLAFELPQMLAGAALLAVLLASIVTPRSLEDMESAIRRRAPRDP